MLNALASVLLWHRELALLPMVVGVLVPGMFLGIWFRTGSRVLAGALTSLLVLASLHVGWTALLNSIDAESVYVPGSFVVLLGAFGLLAFGALASFATYWHLLSEGDEVTDVAPNRAQAEE